MGFQKYGHQDDNNQVERVIKGENTEAASEEDAKSRWFVEDQERVPEVEEEEETEDNPKEER